MSTAKSVQQIYTGENFLTGEETNRFAEAAGLALSTIPGGKWIGKKLLDKLGKGLPNNPTDLLSKGYKETSHPGAAKAGHRTFENPNTGDKLRFDQGKAGATGYEGIDHYHRYNPNSSGKTDLYLDKAGNPCARGCDASHLLPGD